MRRALSISVAATVVTVFATPLRAQAIAEPQGQPLVPELQQRWQYRDRPPQFGDPRFAFRRAGDGYRRIDIGTGEIASCRKRGAGWDCVAVSDERSVIDAEIARLQRENALLTDALIAHGLPLPDGATPAATERATPEPAPASSRATAQTQIAAEPPVPTTPPEPPVGAPALPAGEPPRPSETMPPATTSAISEPPAASHPVPPETVPPATRLPATGDQAARNDNELDRSMHVMEKAWRRLVDMMAAIQRDMRKS